MADRTAARIMGKVFKIISDHVPAPKAKKVALEIWEEMDEWDFNPYQMYVDEYLIKLGLARVMTPEEDQENGTEGGITYWGEEGF